MRGTRAVLGFTLVALSFVPQARAQITTGALTGRVADETGAALPHVSMEAINQATQAVRTMLTGDAGDYTFALLPPGIYTVKAELQGFATLVQADIKVLVNEIVRVDITLRPSTLKQTVEVKGAPPPLQTQTAEVGGEVEHQTVVSLPLNGRDFIQLVALQPGAVSTAKLAGGGLSYLTQTFGGNYIVHGAPSDATSFLFDGIEMRDPNDTRVSFELTVDAIQEFKVQALDYSAAFGRASGGIVNVASRGGTNAFHGSAWEFLRNDKLDARNFFDTTRLPFHQNQFGGSLGGPVIKDKVFFFVSYEALRRIKGLTQATSVPTVAQRNGDFSADAPIFNPLDVDPVTGLRRPFQGNRIRETLFSPVAVKALQALFPLPNAPGEVNNLFGSAKQVIDTDQVNSRVDAKLSSADSLYGRFTEVRADRNLPFVFCSTLPNFINVYNSPAVNSVLSETHTFGPNTVNEAKFGYNRHVQVLEDLQQKVPIDQELGITGTTTNPLFQGNPNIRIAGEGVTGAIGNAPNNRSDNEFTWLDNLTHVSGTHTYSMGASVVRQQVNGGVACAAHGVFAFNGCFTAQLTPTGTLPSTGNAVADFLLGFPISAERCCVVGDPYKNNRRTMFGAYFQQNWKVRPDLTLNLGIRYDYYQRYYDTRDRFDQPDLTKAPQAVLLFAGKNGVPRGIVDPQWNEFSPRVGLAYSISPKTVVRAGYGVFFNPISLVQGVVYGINEPFTDTDFFFANPSLTPQLTLANPFPPGFASPSEVFGAIDRHLRDFYNQNWNLTFERDLGFGSVVTVSYVGNKGTKLPIGLIDRNAPFPPAPGNIASRRPVPAFSFDFALTDQGKSNYHGLEVKAEKRFSNNLGFLVSYVYSKCLDTGAVNSWYDGAPGPGRDPNNTTASYGSCVNDVRHRVVSNAIYELPFGRGRSGLLAKLEAGWSIQGILTLEGGQPFPVFLPYDNSNTNEFADYPDLVPGQNPNNGPKTPNQWFNLKAFQAPPPFTFGNAGRDITRGPPLRTFDFSLHKDTGITERQTLQFRAEFFNILNHPSFFQPGNVFGTPSFGVIGGAFDPREIQFALKYVF